MDCTKCKWFDGSVCRSALMCDPHTHNKFALSEDALIELKQKAKMLPVTDTQDIKEDAHKLKMSLITWKAVRWIVRIRMYGLKKYPDAENYKKVPEVKWFEAALRHLFAYGEGEIFDPESGYPHLAHAITNLAYLIELSCKNPTVEEDEK